MDRQAQILSLIRKVTKKDVNPSADESLFESGVLDSFALADLVNALEKEFSIKIPDADLNPRKFDSLERIKSYVESRS